MSARNRTKLTDPIYDHNDDKTRGVLVRCRPGSREAGSLLVHQKGRQSPAHHERRPKCDHIEEEEHGPVFDEPANGEDHLHKGATGLKAQAVEEELEVNHDEL